MIITFMKKMKRGRNGQKLLNFMKFLKHQKLIIEIYIDFCEHTSNLMIWWSLGTRFINTKCPFQSERPSMVLGYMLLGITASVSAMICLHRKFRNCPKIYTHQRIVSLKTLSSSFPAKNLWQCETFQCSFFFFLFFLNISHVYQTDRSP